jgi:hypothetical protein
MQTTNFELLEKIEKIRSEGLEVEDKYAQAGYMGGMVMKLRGWDDIDVGTQLEGRAN